MRGKKKCAHACRPRTLFRHAHTPRGRAHSRGLQEVWTQCHQFSRYSCRLQNMRQRGMSVQAAGSDGVLYLCTRSRRSPGRRATPRRARARVATGPRRGLRALCGSTAQTGRLGRPGRGAASLDAHGVEVEALPRKLYSCGYGTVTTVLYRRYRSTVYLPQISTVRVTRNSIIHHYRHNWAVESKSELTRALLVPNFALRLSTARGREAGGAACARAGAPATRMLRARGDRAGREVLSGIARVSYAARGSRYPRVLFRHSCVHDRCFVCAPNFCRQHRLPMNADTIITKLLAARESEFTRRLCPTTARAAKRVATAHHSQHEHNRTHLD